MSNDQIGWEIAGTFYPHVGFEGLLHGDHALMREVTGLTLSELDSGEDPEATETAWIAVAVWHQNLELRRGEVRKFVERLPKDGAKRIGFEENAEAPLDESPSPDSGKTSSSSDSTPADSSSGSASPNTTKSPADTTPEPSTPSGSGGQPSATGATSPRAISAPSTSAAA